MLSTEKFSVLCSFFILSESVDWWSISFLSECFFRILSSQIHFVPILSVLMYLRFLFESFSRFLSVFLLTLRGADSRRKRRIYLCFTSNLRPKYIYFSCTFSGGFVKSLFCVSLLIFFVLFFSYCVLVAFWLLWHSSETLDPRPSENCYRKRLKILLLFFFYRFINNLVIR